MNAEALPGGPMEAQRRKADLLRCLRLSTSEGVMAMPIVTMALPVNVVLTALVTQVFPLSTAMIGVFSSLPFVANFLQVAAVPLLGRWRPPKTVSIAAATLHMLTWVAFGVLLPHIPRHDPVAAGRWLVVWFLTSSLFSAIAGVTWNSWIQEWVPPRIRGKYFGRRNGIQQISTLLFLLGAGWLLAEWNYAVGVFQAIIGGAVFLRLFSLRWQWISPTRALRPPPVGHVPLPDQFRILLGSRSFLLFVAFGAVWSFAAYCFGPFYQVFMFKPIGFSAWNVGVVSTLSQLGGVLSLPAWGRLLDRHGNKSVMTLSLILWQLQYFLWCFLTPDNRWLLYGMWTWAGATSAGFVLGQFTLLLKLLPVEAKDLAIGLNLAVTSLFAAIAPILGGWVLGRALAGGSDPLAVYHGFFLLQPLLALGGAFLLLRVREPDASPFSSVVGAMRNIRTLGGVLGLSFLVNYTFIRPDRFRRGRGP
jgi:MFS family permease